AGSRAGDRRTEGADASDDTSDRVDRLHALGNDLRAVAGSDGSAQVGDHPVESAGIAADTAERWGHGGDLGAGDRQVGADKKRLSALRRQLVGQRAQQVSELNGNEFERTCCVGQRPPPERIDALGSAGSGWYNHKGGMTITGGVNASPRYSP